MTRRIVLILVTALVLVAMPSLWSLRRAAKQPPEQPRAAEFPKEIKQLREQVAALEKRVSKLEPKRAELHHDKQGVLYDERNAPVGYWGVDLEPEAYTR